MVEVKTIEKIAEDYRGSTHFFDTDRSGQFVVGYRKAGTLNARHYHKELSKNKNPEILILMQGEITINWFDVRDKEKKGVCKAIAPAMITVQAWAWHEVLADTDIVFFELNSLEDGQKDSFRI
jgi:dTDP-4-dehydrorhamnose 3,5-epimerase-like enzyme